MQVLLSIKLSYDEPSIVRRVTIEPFIGFGVLRGEKDKKREQNQPGQMVSF